MNKRKFQIKLTYFKTSGKYYSEGECEVEAGEIVAGEGTPEAYSIAYTYDVLDAVALMDPHPGLVGRWTEGPILVTGPEMSPPHLITDLEGARRCARGRQLTAQSREAERRAFKLVCTKCKGTGEVHGVGSHAFACSECHGSGLLAF